MNNLKLDLGAGGRPRKDFTGVDIVSFPGTMNVPFDLVSGNKWPWKDGEVDELHSSHFIEHIAADYVEVMRANINPYRQVDEILEPRTFTPPYGGASNPEPSARPLVYRVLQDRLFFFFDEAFRVIKPGGLFHLTWPALKSSDAFRDPTHRRFIPLEMTHYLSRSGREAMGLHHYVVDCNWIVVEDSVRLHTQPLETLPPEGLKHPWNEYEYTRLWDVQKAVSLTLHAEK